MPKKIFFVLLILLLCGCAKKPPEKVAGYWTGALDVTVSPMLVALDLKQDGDKLSGEFSLSNMQARIGFAGKIEGKVDGDGVDFNLIVPDAEKKELKWSDLQFKGIVTVEEGERVLKGWVKREANGKKDNMESIFSPAKAEAP